MKVITLKISDRVFQDLENEVFARKLACASYGPIDELMAKMIQAIKNGEEEREFVYKSERDEEE